MPSIGPQLPPHLQKRKRSTEDEEDEDGDQRTTTSRPPPTKVTRQAPPLNADKDDDDDDSYGHRPIGPSLPLAAAAATERSPPTRAATRPTIGPSLPPASNGDEIALSDQDSDDNHNDNKDTKRPTLSNPPAPKRTFGPAPPPAPLDERPSGSPNPDPDPDSDSDSDDYGPALPSAHPSSSKGRDHADPASSRSQARDREDGGGVPRRDDWMLAPPTSTGYRVTDPTKLKARKFASGRSARSDGSSKGVSAIWTETPEEKARRLADAVLGRGGGSDAQTMAGGGGSNNTAAEEEEKRIARVRQYTEQSRGRSLYQEHQEQRKLKKSSAASGSSSTKKPGADPEEEDDPSKRAFDREKDMGLATRVTGSQRRELLNRAADFGGRFQKGKYL